MVDANMGVESQREVTMSVRAPAIRQPPFVPLVKLFSLHLRPTDAGL